MRDTGPGIPEDEIPKVLQAFGQGALAHQTAEGGAGLGLAIVQNLIELHGGSLQLRSELRKGTDAKVTLPGYRVLRAMAPAAAAWTGNAPAPAGVAAAPAAGAPAPEGGGRCRRGRCQPQLTRPQTLCRHSPDATYSAHNASRNAGAGQRA